MQVNIKEIFERADIKQFRQFLLGGVKTDENCYGTYQERLDRDSEDIIYTLKRILKDSDDKDNKLNESMDDLSFEDEQV